MGSTGQEKPKVICLGLGRTGTSSLRDALALLGFGPCYHMWTILQDDRKDDFAIWSKVGEGISTLDDIKAVLDQFGSVLDYPAAIYGPELYAAYPDAKFILTTRNPKKWGESMKRTILRVVEALRQHPDKSPMHRAMADWVLEYMENKYHGYRFYENAPQEIIDHNERVKQLIPPEKLLVYEVGEGWDRLVDFLEVPKPNHPFPHVNDTAQFSEFQEHDYVMSAQKSCRYKPTAKVV